MNKPDTRLAIVVFLLSCLCLTLLGGCGQTGPLYLPQPEKTLNNESL